MTSGHSFLNCPQTMKSAPGKALRQITSKSRTLIKKAVKARDHEALDALILDIEHTVHLAAANLGEILSGTATISKSFGKYYSLAMETLSEAEMEYQKLARVGN
jgi:hypothetical protein